MIGKSLEILFCFTNLGILAQYPDLGECSFSLENHWNIYFVLPTLVYCNNLSILGNVVIFYQLWLSCSQYRGHGVLCTGVRQVNHSEAQTGSKTLTGLLQSGSRLIISHASLAVKTKKNI